MLKQVGGLAHLLVYNHSDFSKLGKKMQIEIIPLIGLGTWKLQGAECERTIKQALDLGYRHIDTADYYGNHQSVGKAIATYSREEIFLTTKIRGDDARSEQVLSAVERFLEELSTHYIDLLLLHWPNSSIDPIETLNAMSSFQKQGIVKYIGVSNFNKSHLEALISHNFPILTNQIEFHPYLQTHALIEYHKKLNIIITAYSPLAQGAIVQDITLTKIGQKYNKTASQVVLRWILQKGFPVIPKATSKQHLKENISIFDFHLDSSDMQMIDTLQSIQEFDT